MGGSFLCRKAAHPRPGPQAGTILAPAAYNAVR